MSSAEEKKVASEKIINFQPDKKRTCILARDKSPTKEEIVLALTPFVRYETKTDKNGKTKQYVVRECPNKKYCKNEGGLIRFLNKSGYKNPHSHLRVCVAKVSTAVISHQYYTHDLYLYITFPTVRRGCIVGDILSNHQSKDPPVKNEFAPKDRHRCICSYPKGCRDLRNDKHDYSKELTSRYS